MKIVKQIVFTLFALMFINAGLNKFFMYMPAQQMTPEQMEIAGAILKLKWLFPLLGIMETTGGLLVIFPKTRALGALVIFPVMVGIVLHHTTLDPSIPGLPIAIVLLIINSWMLVDNYKKYRPIIA
ncbi:DoxX family protein [Niabella ginsenosidivorans]|uniref:DoxX family protein n=1 Tax=Niabella ginsenosidivorans TaxID=1176587 RepID=A0A1A9I5Q1_9BACT|nr:DoxX family protein [Niabella ginsenosidivorans]ANH83017.1 DoxX family protein [Niabella ginsenosidivorans]